MKRSWLQIVCIVVAGLASTTGCGNKPTQTADATGAPSAGPSPGQYNPPTGASHGASSGSVDGDSDTGSPAGPSGHGGPASGGPASGGPGDGGHGGPSSGGPSSGGPSGHGGPASGGPSTGDVSSGSAPPYGAGYGAATGYGGGGTGSTGMSGPGAPGVGMTGLTGAGGSGSAPGGNSGSMAGGLSNGGNAGTPPISRPAPPKKLTFEERSKIAFQAGNTTRAYDLAYAHSLMSPDSDAMKVAAAYRVAPTKSSPSLGIQVAVGLSLEKPDGLTDLKPIGTDWQSITGSGGSPGGGPGAGMGAPGMGGIGMGGIGMPGMGGAQTSTSAGSKALTDAAGSLATDFIDAFKEEHSEGKWSLFFKDEELKGRAMATGQPGMGGMGGMAGGFSQDGEGTAGGMSGVGGFGAAGAAGSGGSGAPGGALQFRQSGAGIPGIGAGGGDDMQDGPGMAGVGIGGPGGVGHGAPAGAGPGAGGPGAGGPGGIGHGAGAPGGMGPGGMGPGGMGPGGMGPGGMGPGGMGPGGMAGDSGFGSAPGMGGFGSAPGMGGQAAAMGGARQVIDPADVKLEQGIVPLAPCLHYIGSGDAKTLVETAFERGYDVLVIFEVEVTQNRRNNVVTNTALIRCVIPADTPKNVESIVKSKSLVNRDVAQARKKSEDDGIEDVIKSVLRRMGEKVSLQPIPDKLTPEYVTLKRLPAILANEKLSKLCKLSEVNFYYHKGYLDEAQRADFYERIAGDLAEDVLSEDLEQRETAILELLNS
ncbi:MAG: hypothetical protein ACK5YR_19985 [Pirellula sp.]